MNALEAINAAAVRDHERTLFRPLRLRLASDVWSALTTAVYSLSPRYAEVHTPHEDFTITHLSLCTGSIPITIDAELSPGYVIAEAHHDCRIWRITPSHA